jgi:DNA polymerase-4
MGVETCGDLQAIPLNDLVRRFGRYGRRLHEVAHGVDERDVQPSRVRKSISVERTFRADLEEMAAMREALEDILDELQRRFSRIERDYLPSGRFIKVKFRDFTQTTLEAALHDPAEAWRSNEAFDRLLQGAWPRGAQPVRLLGAGLRLRPLRNGAGEQLALFDDPVGCELSG